MITPSPIQNPDPSKTYRFARRDILSDVVGDVGSVLQGLGSDIPSYVASGVPNFFQDFPIGGDAQKKANVSDDDLAAIPTQVLNIPWVTC